MFGQSHWFRARAGRSGLCPATWQGWVFLAGWSAIALLPSLLLTSRGLWPEGLIWMGAVALAWKWESRQLRRQTAEAPLEVREVLVIDDSGTRVERRAV